MHIAVWLGSQSTALQLSLRRSIERVYRPTCLPFGRIDCMLGMQRSASSLPKFARQFMLLPFCCLLQRAFCALTANAVCSPELHTHTASETDNKLFAVKLLRTATAHVVRICPKHCDGHKCIRLQPVQFSSRLFRSPAVRKCRIEHKDLDIGGI